VARFFFLFVFLGQNRLQNIARLRDVRQVDLRNNRRLRVARGPAGRVRTLMGLLR